MPTSEPEHEIKTDEKQDEERRIKEAEASKDAEDHMSGIGGRGRDFRPY